MAETIDWKSLVDAFAGVWWGVVADQSTRTVDE